MIARLGALAYPAATGAGALLTFLTIPLVVRSAGPANFGLWGLLESATALLAQFVVLGLNFFTIRIVGQHRRRAAALLPLLGRLLPPGILLVLGILAVIAAIGLMPVALVPTLMLWIVGEGLFLVGQSCLRGQQRPLAWALAVLARQCTVLTWLHAAPDLGASPLTTLSMRLATAAWLAAGISFLAAWGQGKTTDTGQEEAPPAPDWRTAVAYGAPLLLSSLLGLAATQLDRWWLVATWSPEVLGHYSLHLKVAAVMSPTIIAPLALWWPPFVFRLQGEEPAVAVGKLSRALRHILLAYITVATLLILAGPYLLAWMAPGLTLDLRLLALLISVIGAQGLAGIFSFGQLIAPRPWGIPAVQAVGFAAQAAIFALLPSPASPTAIAAATGTVALVLLVAQGRLSNAILPGVLGKEIWLGLLPWLAGLMMLAAAREVRAWPACALTASLGAGWLIITRFRDKARAA
ncbi:MAG: oligosaccharide flippase family protein [Candidatus Sericytochromatia bacterium]|nr:oligosaccharide flippase family protein [Candidatus Tanganyikabacteria bacterium]